MEMNKMFQIPCTVEFKADAKCIKILQEQLNL